MLPGNLAPRQQEHLLHLASCLPFAQVVTMLARLLGVQSSQETVRRLTEQAGQAVEAAHTQEAQAPWSEEPPPVPAPVRLAMSADGANVPLRKGEWAEVRTLAVGVVKQAGSSEELSEKVALAPVVFFSL